MDPSMYAIQNAHALMDNHQKIVEKICRMMANNINQNDKLDRKEVYALAVEMRGVMIKLKELVDEIFEKHCIFLGK
jgi:hypothetical protein